MMSIKSTRATGTSKTWGLVALVIVTLALAGCSGNVGVGMSVGVPIGNHGYMSVGGNRWY